MTTIPLEGQVIKYSDIQKAFGGKDSNSFTTAASANSLNTANNYTISGLSLGSSGNISDVGTITASIFSSAVNLNVQTINSNDILFKNNTTERMRISATGNVGIGTTSPTKQLDVNNDINAIEYFIKGINISNIFISSNYRNINVTSNPRFSVNETTSPSLSSNIYNSSYYYYVFSNSGGNQTSYTITFNNPTTCDILVVGGGGGGYSKTGSGSSSTGGGGGAGQVIFSSNVLVLNGTYNIYVGNGGVQNTNGYNSSFNNIIAYGGYGATGVLAEMQPDGLLGGPKGGNSGSNVTVGGFGYWNDGTFGGGGAGAGGNGGNYRRVLSANGSYYKFFYAGNGGLGVDFSSVFGTSVGDNGWFGSGGGGSVYDVSPYEFAGTASLGGGGIGGKNTTYDGEIGGNGGNGMANTGGGGGASAGRLYYSGGFWLYNTGGSGGSGVVIIRILRDYSKFYHSLNLI